MHARRVDSILYAYALVIATVNIQTCTQNIKQHTATQAPYMVQIYDVNIAHTTSSTHAFSCSSSCQRSLVVVGGGRGCRFVCGGGLADVGCVYADVLHMSLVPNCTTVNKYIWINLGYKTKQSMLNRRYGPKRNADEIGCLPCHLPRLASYVCMYSDVMNCETSAVLPTPASPIITTRYLCAGEKRNGPP